MPKKGVTMCLKGCSLIGYKAIFIQNMEKSSSERGFIRYISKHPNHSLKVHLIGISPYTDIGKHLQEYRHTIFLSFSPYAFFFAFSSYGFPVFFSIKLRKMAKHSIQPSLSHTSILDNR